MSGDRVARLGLVVVTVVVLQVGVVSQFRVAGAAGDLVLALAVAAGLAGGPDRGAAVGFAAGLLLDLFLTTPFGLAAFTAGMTAYVVGLVRGGLIGGSPLVPVLIGPVGCAGGTLLFALLGAVLGRPDFLGPDLLVVLAVVAVFGAVAVPLLRRPLVWAFPADSRTRA